MRKRRALGVTLWFRLVTLHALRCSRYDPGYDRNDVPARKTKSERTRVSDSEMNREIFATLGLAL